ncbi:hypothetical protein KSZ_31350 [Dictyobacter formicarum]|uniref:Uncharacterized protein n=2 Tax=Dictyobacter formicarum TaxID=2778368 RepID=A0ABQ3VHE8_9CHLR|nr:hypothetical protein KSZ_31350 [Dictyobacter formicarum]
MLYFRGGSFMENFDELDNQVLANLMKIKKKRDANLRFRAEQKERLEKTLNDPLLSPVAKSNIERQLRELITPND